MKIKMFNLNKKVAWAILALFIAWSVFNAVRFFSSMAQNVSITEKAIGEFHQQLNNQQFDELIPQNSNEFKDPVVKEKSHRFYKVISSKLGLVKSTKIDGVKVNGDMFGTTVVLIMKTDYENDQAVEQFVYRVSGKHAVLSSYNINSKALVYN